jgi:hypothetical protein
MIRTVVSILLVVGVPLAPSSAQESGALAKFVGDWSCKGNFASNSGPIAADLSIQPDEGSGALIVRHDDVAPGAYHATTGGMTSGRTMLRAQERANKRRDGDSL